MLCPPSLSRLCATHRSFQFTANLKSKPFSFSFSVNCFHCFAWKKLVQRCSESFLPFGGDVLQWKQTSQGVWLSARKAGLAEVPLGWREAEDNTIHGEFSLEAHGSLGRAKLCRLLLFCVGRRRVFSPRHLFQCNWKSGVVPETKMIFSLACATVLSPERPTCGLGQGCAELELGPAAAWLGQGMTWGWRGALSPASGKEAPKGGLWTARPIGTLRVCSKLGALYFTWVHRVLQCLFRVSLYVFKSLSLYTDVLFHSKYLKMKYLHLIYFTDLLWSVCIHYFPLMAIQIFFCKHSECCFWSFFFLCICLLSFYFSFLIYLLKCLRALPAHSNFPSLCLQEYG